MTTITNSALVQTVYTEKGNKYEKINAGKKAGVLSAAIVGGQHLKDFGKVANLILEHDELVKGRNAKGFAEATARAKQGRIGKYIVETELPAFASKFLKSKAGKATIAIGCAALFVAAGRVLGGIFDAAVNKFKAHKADKAAEQKEAIIKEYEAQKASEE